jgi:uncharacterized protein YecE (DUF72 family)
MLHFYAEKFSTVEINNSFYRMPSAEVLTRWSEQVPDRFVFVLKAPRRITHQQQLHEATESVSYFWKAAGSLGPKLGPVLFQLPPFLKKDLPRLRAFLAQLPEGCRAAFEFRHSSWFDADTFEALRAARAALCLADTDEQEPPVVATADSEAQLHLWAERVRAQPWKEVYVFFKHEDEGKAPRLAAQFSPLVST